jgi:cardiolipin synthase
LELDRPIAAPTPRELAPPDSVQLLRDGAEAFPAWLEAIASAQDEILVEMYWFDSDRTGWRFAEALMERARAGCDVFVLYDAVGSFGADRAMFAALEAAGARVLEFHPIAPWRKRFRLDVVWLRDHRKIIVVDAKVGFTGGINICDKAAPKDQGGEGWRDDAVKITGPAVLELRALFFDTWLRLGGPSPRRGAAVVRRARRALVAAARAQSGSMPPPPDPAVPVAPAPTWRERFQRAAARISRSGGEITPARPRGVRTPPRIQVLGHAAWGARRSIRNLYVRHIRAARKMILIENAYFIPDGIVRRALVAAARRGVEVRVIVPRRSDVPSVSYAARAMYAGLMRAGVHIHEWLDGMMHAKSAVIDGWATVGSYNLDYRSLFYNLEVNVASEDPGFAAQVEASIRADLARCTEVDPVAWAQRPWHQKFLEWVHYLVRQFL